MEDSEAVGELEDRLGARDLASFSSRRKNHAHTIEDAATFRRSLSEMGAYASKCTGARGLRPDFSSVLVDLRLNFSNAPLVGVALVLAYNVDDLHDSHDANILSPCSVVTLGRPGLTHKVTSNKQAPLGSPQVSAPGMVRHGDSTPERNYSFYPFLDSIWVCP